MFVVWTFVVCIISFHVTTLVPCEAFRVAFTCHSVSTKPSGISFYQLKHSHSKVFHRISHYPTTISSTNLQAHLLPTTILSSDISLPSVVGGGGGGGGSGVSAGVDTSYLWTYFWQVVITNGVPAIFTILVVAFIAFKLRPRNDYDSNNDLGSMMMSSIGSSRQDKSLKDNNPLALLYDDLYGDLDQDPLKQKNQLSSLFDFSKTNNNNKNMLPKNTGVPLKQYVKVTHLNKKYDSYQFSLTAATQSKAVAAAAYRRSAFRRAFGKTVTTAINEEQDYDDKTIDLPILGELQRMEQKYLSQAIPMTNKINLYQQQLTAMAIQGQVQESVQRKEDVTAIYTTIDPKINLLTKNTTTTTTTTNVTDLSTSTSATSKTVTNMLLKAQTEMFQLELDFVKDIVRTVGPKHAPAIQATFMGSGGSLLQTCAITGERPLEILLSDTVGNDETNHNAKKVLYVMNFPGDVTASQVSELRELVTAIVLAQKRRQTTKGTTGEVSSDEALVVLQSGGGTVTGYGLAAAQLLRLKEVANLKLTICVEQVAASGGYMMACIADKIIASPFAVLGSIGVISDIPNVYDRLKKEGIEFLTVTAGKYKRTLTPTKKVTKEDFEKSKEDIEEIFGLFRDFVKQNRPKLDIDKVATGETWFGTAALELNLCDEIKTVDDTLTEYVSAGFDVYQLKYKPPIEDVGTFSRFLQSSSSSSSVEPPWNDSTNNNNSFTTILGQPIRWLVRMIVTAIRDEVVTAVSSISLTSTPSDHDSNNDNLSSFSKRYMAIDDSADRIQS